jgi:hypothetical protein
MMDLTYKLVSDYNLKTNFTKSTSTKGIVPVAEDGSFNAGLPSGNYNILVDGAVKHGAFSKGSATYPLFYFTYETIVNLEKVLVDSVEVTALNPRLVLKDDGNPLILFYDPLTSRTKSVDKQTDGTWNLQTVDFVSMSLPIAKRQIDLIKASQISGAYVYTFNVGVNGVKYLTYDGTWTVEDIDTSEVLGDPRTVSLIEDENSNPFVFIGSTQGITVHAKINGVWDRIALYEDLGGVSEIHAEYNSLTKKTDIAYVSSTEVRYQQYDHATKEMFDLYKFIDFASSSISLTLNSEGLALISYSHIENSLPLTISLKVAREQSDGLFQTFVVDSSDNGFVAGALSDIELSDDDKIFVLYQNNGIKLYDEQKDIDESFIETTSWKDRRLVNNLISCNNPPTRDIDNTYMQFDSSVGQFFFKEDPVDLDSELTAFSMTFGISPQGGGVQTVVSKGSLVDGGYEIYLAGDEGLTLGFSIVTIYETFETLITDLPIDEKSKVAFVYSGYDVKVYVKKAEDASFTVYRYNVFGDLKVADNPFVIGASSSPISEANPYCTYPLTVEYNFENYLNAKIFNLKYWKRELRYEEASYHDDSIFYKNILDPYSDNLDYKTFKSASGASHFILNGENLAVKDYGGVDKINLINYSNFNAEFRVTNSSNYSVSPSAVKKKKGGMEVVWGDKRSGHSEIYINTFNSNNNVDLFESEYAVIKSSGNRGRVSKNSNVFVDFSAKFLDEGVYLGDFLNLTSGSTYVGRKIPILNILSNTTLEIGAYFSKTEEGLGYYIDTKKIDPPMNLPVELSRLYQNSINPAAVTDSINDTHVVWQSLNGEFYDIYYQRYRSNFAKEQIWGSTRVTDKLEGHAQNPSLAIDKDDGLHMVWEDHRNKFGSIMYAVSSKTVEDGDPEYVRWSASNYLGKDFILTDNLDCKDPKIAVDQDSAAHIVFSAKVGENNEIFYVTNRTGRFSAPTQITNLQGDARDSQIVIDGKGNIIVVFSGNKGGKENIYLSKYDVDERKWKLAKLIVSTPVESVRPTIALDADSKVYIFWIDKDGQAHNLRHAVYNSVNDSLEVIDERISTDADTSLLASATIDDTKTVYISWEDIREGSEEGSEIYRNNSINLIAFDEREESPSVEDKTDEEIVEEQLSRYVVGKQYPDEIPPSQLPQSDESLDKVVVTFRNDNQSFEVPLDMFKNGDPIVAPESIVLNSRRVTIDIKGLPRTLAYRIKNEDDSNASFSEFFEFSIDIFPDTTTTEWLLSSGNGQKTVCFQFYTLQGLTSIACQDLFVNEPDLYDILLFNNSGDQIGEVVDTEYQNTKVLTTKTYWVKIKPRRTVIVETEKVVFNVDTQGETIENVETEFDGEYFVGKFTIQPHDGIRYIDGDAKIIPRIENK